MQQLRLYILSIFFLPLITLSAQEIISVEFRTNVSQTTFQAVIGGIISGVDVTNGVDLYKVSYTTTGSDMLPDTASGLLCIPDIIEGPRPLLNYQHGTTDGRNDVPSNLSGNEYLLAASFSSLGFIAFAPDYLGMGESRGFHPYVHAETEASATIDMMAAVYSYLEEQEVPFSDQLFLTGYSQGGHAAMAVYQELEANYADQYDVTAALPMSGPYNISGVMLDLVLSEEEFFYPAYLVYTVLGIQAVEPDFFPDLSAIFREEYLADIQDFAATGEGLFTLNVNLLTIMTNKYGSSSANLLFTPEILADIAANEEHPFRLELQKSDVYDWTPTSPTLMLYCEDDDQVSYLNTVLADSTMNANGAPDVSSMDVSGDQMLDHTSCIAPALQVGVPWLLSYVEGQDTPTVELPDGSTIDIYPNPFSDFIKIAGDTEIDMIRLIDINGRLLYQETMSGSSTSIPTSSLESGIYFLRISSEASHRMIKLVKS